MARRLSLLTGVRARTSSYAGSVVLPDSAFR